MVNLIDGSDVPVDDHLAGRRPVGQGADSNSAAGSVKRAPTAPPGRYKYVVSALDAQEDPEIEIPGDLDVLPPLGPQHAARPAPS